MGFSRPFSIKGRFGNPTGVGIRASRRRSQERQVIMASLASEIFGTQMVEFFGRFGRFGGTLKQLADLAGDDDLMKKWVESLPGLIAAREKNPYEMTVDQQLTALRRANDEERWGLTEADFSRLAETAPAWPQGKHAYRSFRIRFGEGSEGVAKTFEAHYERIKHVHGEGRYWRWELMLSTPTPYQGTDREMKKRYGDKPIERLRLLSGDHTHKACVEWIVADLDTHRKRESITAVRDSKSLADELLVIAWMFPDMIRAIDYDKLPGLFAGGYEVNVPEYDDETWQDVVIVYFGRDDRQVRVSAHDRGSDVSDYSVPRLRESPALGA